MTVFGKLLQLPALKLLSTLTENLDFRNLDKGFFLSPDKSVCVETSVFSAVPSETQHLLVIVHPHIFWGHGIFPWEKLNSHAELFFFPFFIRKSRHCPLTHYWSCAFSFFARTIMHGFPHYCRENWKSGNFWEAVVKILGNLLSCWYYLRLLDICYSDHGYTFGAIQHDR